MSPQTSTILLLYIVATSNIPPPTPLWVCTSGGPFLGLCSVSMHHNMSPLYVMGKSYMHAEKGSPPTPYILWCGYMNTGGSATPWDTPIVATPIYRQVTM